MAEVALLIERLDTGTRRGRAADADLQAAKHAGHRRLRHAAGGHRRRAGRRSGAARNRRPWSCSPSTPKGERLLKSGILNDVQITPDPRPNTLIVAAPAESMDSAGRPDPASSTRPAPWPRSRSSASSTATPPPWSRCSGRCCRRRLGRAGRRSRRPKGETSLVPLRFSVDTRTNSIIAIGSPGDLQIVEALLLRLDSRTPSNARPRSTG